MSLHIDISADSKFPVDRKQLRNRLEEIWREYAIDIEVNLSVAVVGTRKMAELHKKYLNQEGPTDVLAFPQQSWERGNKGFISKADSPLELGDIVICYPLAIDQAIKQCILVDERIVELAIHGFKNILDGYETSSDSS